MGYVNRQRRSMPEEQIMPAPSHGGIIFCDLTPGISGARPNIFA